MYGFEIHFHTKDNLSKTLKAPRTYFKKHYRLKQIN